MIIKTVIIMIFLSFGCSAWAQRDPFTPLSPENINSNISNTYPKPQIIKKNGKEYLIYKNRLYVKGDFINGAEMISLNEKEVIFKTQQGKIISFHQSDKKNNINKCCSDFLKMKKWIPF